MSSQHERDLLAQELVARNPRTTSLGGYCFVRSTKRGIVAAPAVAATEPAPVVEAVPTPIMAVASVPTVELEAPDFEESVPTVQVPNPVPAEETAIPEEPARAAVAAYRDPDLCSCSRMMQALRDKFVDVIFEGPVTLPPAVMTEGAMLSGRWDATGVERAYDGKPWAFRFCPFHVKPVILMDNQVDLPEMLNDGCHCCATMRLAEQHGRVALPPPERSGLFPQFTGAGTSGIPFQTCPWCATSTDDLVLSRFKRHLAARRT